MSKVVWWLAWMGCAAGLAPAASSAAEEFQNKKSEARAAIGRRAYAEAVRLAGDLNRRVPDDVEIYCLLVDGYLGLGKIEEAERAAQWILDLRVGRPEPAGLLRVARVRAALGDRDGALEMLRQALVKLPSGAKQERAEVMAEVERIEAKKPAPRAGQAAEFLQKLRETANPDFLDRAAALLEAELREDPSSAPARRAWIEVLLHRHDFAGAIAAARKLIAEGVDTADVYGMLGDAHVERGEYNEAERAYQAMLDRRPGLASYNRAAHFRWLTGDPEGAVELMRKAADTGSVPEHVAWCLVELGNFHWKLSALDAAERAFLTARERFPASHAALAGLGRVFASRGQYDEAAASFRKAQAMVPLPEYAGALADLHQRLGREEEAARQRDLLDLADRLDQARGERTNRTLALLYADQNRKLDRALALVEAELEVRKDVYTYDAYAWALHKLGRNEEAAAAMREACKLGTPEPAFRRHAAAIGVSSLCPAPGRAD